MTSYVALLRGINLGPYKRVAMSDLRTMLEGLGYEEVRTYLESGNALFSSGRGDSATHERTIATSISSELGLDVKVLVRSGEELTAVVKRNPFAKARDDQKMLHAVFLQTPLKRSTTTAIDRAGYEPDRFEFGDRVIYLCLTRGVQGSRLPNWEKLLRVSATMRTWNVVTRLRDMTAG